MDLLCIKSPKVKVKDPKGPGLRKKACELTLSRPHASEILRHKQCSWIPLVSHLVQGLSQGLGLHFSSSRRESLA